MERAVEDFDDVLLEALSEADESSSKSYLASLGTSLMTASGMAWWVMVTGVTLGWAVMGLASAKPATMLWFGLLSLGSLKIESWRGAAKDHYFSNRDPKWRTIEEVLAWGLFAGFVALSVFPSGLVLGVGIGAFAGEYLSKMIARHIGIDVTW